MTDQRRLVGAAGEEAALAELKRSGLRLLHRNLRLGRLGELDIVMSDGSVLVFVEVKSKLSGDGLGGRDNVTWAKQRKLVDLATAYMAQYKGKHSGARFDVVEVIFPDASLRHPQITHLRDAFRPGG